MDLDDEDFRVFSSRLLRLDSRCDAEQLLGRTICQDLFQALPHLPDSFVDLLIADPPYNLGKTFNGQTFKARSSDEYEAWLESWLVPGKEYELGEGIRAGGRNTSCVLFSPPATRGNFFSLWRISIQSLSTGFYVLDHEGVLRDRDVPPSELANVIDNLLLKTPGAKKSE